MLRSPQPRQIQALGRLARSADGEALLQYLQAELDCSANQLIDDGVEMVPKLQGGARVMKELVKLLRDAPQLAEAVRPT